MKSIILITAFASAATALAQSERPDTLGVQMPDTLSSPEWMRPHPGYDGSSVLPEVRPLEFDPEYQAGVMRVKAYRAVSGAFAPWRPGEAILASWQGGGITASGSAASMPGLMGVERGAVTIGQQFGPLSLSLSASAQKYGYFRGLQTGYGLDVAARYSITPRLSLTLFGSYRTGLTPLTPAMAGYFDSSEFGGYVSYDFSEHFGVSVGAKATRSLMNRGWEAQPIVMPYYKINKDVSIGADVGGIIYNMIRNYTDSRNDRSPVIGPPVGGPPPVAPRR